jgi:serine/threonine protein kinase
VAEDNRLERPSRGRLRALREWLLGNPTLARTEAPAAKPGDSLGLPSRIGRYQVLRKLGQGGMGVVYAARDERLERTVAIKTLAALVPDETTRKRFWREARAAASVNHPNVCQLYEIGEEASEPFIAMELLEGESLAERLQRGSLPLSEAVPVALGALSALSALHERGLVHRDLKPSNVFLTGHGVKLLDFGLARPSDGTLRANLATQSALTQTGALVGTPRYMAPEQIGGEALDARTDIFAAGAILFEMLAGRPAFVGRTVVEILHATLHEQPPALTGSPAVAAADRAIRRALAKAAKDRYPSADAMAADLRPLAGAAGPEAAVRARALTRLIALPFRILRPDPETDFLAFSLADSISTSLSALGSLVVRSSAMAARFASDQPDLKAIAAEADVDQVVLGTLLRSGDHLRVTTQLVEAPSGTLVASQTVQSPLGDLFRLEEDLTRRLVEALALPLAGREATPRRDVPGSARAYELYLRANEVSRDYDQIPLARDLYLGCLEEDPNFAPAWARVGRSYRIIGKFVEDGPGNRARAEEAFRRALELNPDLTLTHKLVAHLEAELGRAQEAMVRLLRQAERHRDDPELFAGLVHTCRYCGLFEASVAAHDEARRLDPHIPTSLDYTLLLAGDLERLLKGPEGSTSDRWTKLIGLVEAGRPAEAQALFEQTDFSRLPQGLQISIGCLPPIIAGDRVAGLKAVEEAVARYDDPEALFLFATFFGRLGESGRCLDVLDRVVTGGFFVAPTLEKSGTFEEVRRLPGFQEVLTRARKGRDAAEAAFREAGGALLLGI